MSKEKLGNIGGDKLRTDLNAIEDECWEIAGATHRVSQETIDLVEQYKQFLIDSTEALDSEQSITTFLRLAKKHLAGPLKEGENELLADSATVVSTLAMHCAANIATGRRDSDKENKDQQIKRSEKVDDLKSILNSSNERYGDTTFTPSFYGKTGHEIYGDTYYEFKSSPSDEVDVITEWINTAKDKKEFEVSASILNNPVKLKKITTIKPTKKMPKEMKQLIGEINATHSILTSILKSNYDYEIFGDNLQTCYEGHIFDSKLPSLVAQIEKKLNFSETTTLLLSEIYSLAEAVNDGDNEARESFLEIVQSMLTDMLSGMRSIYPAVDEAIEQAGNKININTILSALPSTLDEINEIALERSMSILIFFINVGFCTFNQAAAFNTRVILGFFHNPRCAQIGVFDNLSHLFFGVTKLLDDFLLCQIQFVLTTLSSF